MSSVQERSGSRSRCGAAASVLGFRNGPAVRALAVGITILLFIIAITPVQAGRLDYTPVTYGDRAWYTGIYLADMTGFSTPEVLIGNRTTSSLEIWATNEDGELRRIDNIDLDYQVHDVKAADFDHDNDLDLVVGLRFGGVYYIENTGGPGIVGSWDIRNIDHKYSWQVLVDDLDGDGNLDIIDSTDQDPIFTFYGDGTGDFTQGADIVVPDMTMIEPFGFTIVNLNGDARPDLIGVDGTHMRGFINPGNRAAPWTSVGNIPLGDYPDARPTQASTHLSPAAGDLDGNGLIDQVAFVGTPDEPSSTDLVIIKQGAGGGGLEWWPETLDTMPHRFAAHAGVADLDGDGNMDIHVGGGTWFDGLRVYLGDGGGGFVRENIRLGYGVGGLNGLAAGDINGDGSADIVTVRTTVGGANEGGFVVLYAPAEPQIEGFWTTECVECPPRDIYATSLTERSLQIDNQGRPHIALGGDNLLYVWHDGQAWQSEVADFGLGHSIGGPALVLDAAGRPHISYRHNVDQSLRYAYRTAAGWQIEIVATNIDYSRERTSLALGETPQIAYTVTYFASDGTSHQAVKFAYKIGNDWVTEIVSDEAYGQSLAISPSGESQLSFVTAGGELAHAIRDSENRVWNIYGVMPSVTGGSSLAIDAQGQPHIATVQPDGHILYAKYDNATGWSVESAAREGNNRAPSLALDANGVAHVAYYDATAQAIQHAYKPGGTWKNTSIAASAETPVTLALDGAGKPRVAFLDTGYPSALMFSQATGPSSGWWNWGSAKVAQQGGSMGRVSLALDAHSSAPAVSYCDLQEGTLKFARRGDNGWIAQTVDGIADDCWNTVLALDGAGQAHIAYVMGRPFVLKYARQTTGGWQLETVEPSLSGFVVGLAVDSASRPHMVYRHYIDTGTGDLIYAMRTEAGWQRETLISGYYRGVDPALALTSQGQPRVVYMNYLESGDEVRYAYRDTTGWHTETVKSAAGAIYDAPTLALDSDGVPNIVYPSYEKSHVNFYLTRRYASGWQSEFVDGYPTPPETGYPMVSLALGPGGQPHVAFSDGVSDNAVTYGTRSEAGWTFQRLAGYLGTPELKIDQANMPHLGSIFYRTLHRNSTPLGDPEGFISGGEYHTCGLRPNGAVDCWGANAPANNHGQAAYQPGPFVQVSTGATHSCGLKPDGSVDCWGSNAYGQAEDKTGPFTQISVGVDHNCGLTVDRAIDCWGRSQFGEAAGQTGPFVQVGAGSRSTCGLRPNGSVTCWGLNPIQLDGPFTQLSVGGGHACGLQPNGGVHCWGLNSNGQAEDQAGPFVQISAGGQHSCGLKTNGDIACWGRNNASQATGQATGQTGPFIQVSAGGSWLTSGSDHACGVRANGSVYCWGNNSDGQATGPAGAFGPFNPSIRLPVIMRSQ